MDERKGVTVSYLRELARKYLRGRSGASRGREFVAALAERVPALGRLARMAGLQMSQRSSGDVGGEARTLDSGQPDSGPARGAKDAAVPLPPAGASEARPPELSAEPVTEPSGEPRTRPAQVVTFPARAKSRREPDDDDTLPLAPEALTPRPSGTPRVEVEAPRAAAEATPAPASEPPHAAEPLVEGFFVTKMAGPGEARRHHLLEEQAPRLPPADASPEREERLGMLPLDYQDDAMVLLARDPHTLFVFWDFSDASRKRALDGLPVPRAVLKVFDGEGLSREVDFALESRSFYLLGMTPGRTYRVEAHFVGADGRSRRIGHSSNRATLPPAGPSSDTSIKFLHMPPLPVVSRPRAEVAVAVPVRAPEPEEREYVTWRRVSLPGSAGVRDIPEVHRERIKVLRAPGASDQRYADTAHLESAPRAPGASDQRYEVAVGEARTPGASDQRYLAVERAPGASDQRYLEVPRAPGASDQRYGQGLLPGGVSEYRYLELESPRAPGASDQRYVEGERGQGASDSKYLTVPRAAGASDQRYLTVSSVPGASDAKYLTAPRAAGASDQQYLSPARASGASDQQYLTVPRAAGASDQQYLSPARASGASDQQYLTVPRAAGASDARSSGAVPPSQGEVSLPAKGSGVAVGKVDGASTPSTPVFAQGPVLADSRTQEPESPRVAEPEAPRDPWALSVARGLTASEQRALDRAREAAEAAREAPPAPVPPSPPAPKAEAPVPPSAPPLKAEPSAPARPEPSKNAPEPSTPGSPSASSRSRRSRRGRS
ncbi:DUF4912 domain-containing protein [Corallococcus llansteffanensis]|uniref:DUF4912 domain-containing protein n=1 Tax=Corallococcus llansteffanensis TaxID=2316731 RepID=A0A3A8NU12_9BACT|nr:DUF4912 domain-containing protein [Corallococcus llansteffanensis]RKH47718.1 DUF4912 domain-containing protein [Corallococcus llansteffanensis]